MYMDAQKLKKSAFKILVNQNPAKYQSQSV